MHGVQKYSRDDIYFDNLAYLKPCRERYDPVKVETCHATSIDLPKQTIIDVKSEKRGGVFVRVNNLSRVGLLFGK